MSALTTSIQHCTRGSSWVVSQKKKEKQAPRVGSVGRKSPGCLCLSRHHRCLLLQSTYVPCAAPPPSTHSPFRSGQAPELAAQDAEALEAAWRVQTRQGST